MWLCQPYAASSTGLKVDTSSSMFFAVIRGVQVRIFLGTVMGHAAQKESMLVSLGNSVKVTQIISNTKIWLTNVCLAPQ